MKSIVMIGVPHSATLGKAAAVTLVEAGYDVRSGRADHAFEDLSFILAKQPIDFVFIGEDIPLNEATRLITHFKERIRNGFAFASYTQSNPNARTLIDAGCRVEFWPTRPEKYLEIAARYSPISPS